MKRMIAKGKGFSLVELMIVVGIIGILATLAVPRFRTFQAKARQAEVRTTLTHIHTLQEVYHQERNIYSQFLSAVAGGYGRLAAGGQHCTWSGGANSNAADLGFRISPCDATLPRYGYAQTAAATRTTFAIAGQTANAANQSVYPGCTTAIDLWTLNQDKQIAVSGLANQNIIRDCN